METSTSDLPHCTPPAYPRRAWSVRVLILLSLLVTFGWHAPVVQGDASIDPAVLAERYAPVLYFHPHELFRPQPVEVLLNVARLRQVRRTGTDLIVLPTVSPTALAGYQDPAYYLDVWLGNDGASDYRNYSALRAYYQDHVRPLAGGPASVTYAHVITDEANRHITIQYWFFYFYNDWFNKHEGDWEMIQVILDTAAAPQWAVYTQHRDGTRRPWAATEVEQGTHPVVYVALGSHANYFRGNEVYPHAKIVGSTMVAIMDRTGREGRVQPQVILLPTVGQANPTSPAAASMPWLQYGGGWGERATAADFSGPVGPGQKGLQWDQPYAWGMAQPLDADTWYSNRLRVVLPGESGANARIRLHTSAAADDRLRDELPGIAMLHRDPDPDEIITAEITTAPHAPLDLVASWPDAATSSVTRYTFDDVPAGAQFHALLIMQAAAGPMLTVDGQPEPIAPSSREVIPVVWDAPDFVWIAEVLPASSVVWGVLICLLAALVPVVFYVGVLYYADRYEKEPLQLIVTAFLWGAVPAILVALAAGMFFDLPINLVGAQAIATLRVGLVVPVIEELLKAGMVLFIVHRFRHEIDSVMDGIIYGAVVGLGFAMTGNLLSYLGAFLLHGFDDLQRAIFIEGYLYGVNEAMYAAIFGAGLAYAIFERRRLQRWIIPLGAFILAVSIHALHNLTMQHGTGVYLLDLAITWLGLSALLVIVLRSMVWQRRWLEQELTGEVPSILQIALTRPKVRARSEWQALRTGGVDGWRRTRRVYQLCGKLACRKARSHAHPDRSQLLLEVDSTRQALRELLGMYLDHGEPLR